MAYWSLPAVQQHRCYSQRWMSSDATPGAELPWTCTGWFDRKTCTRGAESEGRKHSLKLPGFFIGFLLLCTEQTTWNEPCQAYANLCRHGRRKQKGPFMRTPFPLAALTKHKRAWALTAASPRSLYFYSFSLHLLLYISPGISLLNYYSIHTTHDEVWTLLLQQNRVIGINRFISALQM